MQTHFKVIANKPYSFVFNLIYDFSIIFMLGFSSEIKGNKKLYIKKKHSKYGIKHIKLDLCNKKNLLGRLFVESALKTNKNFRI